MRAPVRLRHDGDHCDAGRGADGLGTQLREEGVAVRLGDCGDHLHELRRAGETVLPASSGLELVEVNVFPPAGALGHGGDDLGDGADTRFLLGDTQRDGDPASAGRRLLARLRRGHGQGGAALCSNG